MRLEMELVEQLDVGPCAACAVQQRHSPSTCPSRRLSRSLSGSTQNWHSHFRKPCKLYIQHHLLAVLLCACACVCACAP